ncbi:hypothetical protein [Aeromicrobium sp.]|uniref:hypothetical protein n=1 Tax=Aeromicrobium sp. TaxID=1871063 RepID=UPI0028A8742D|nr:hypothetical protein [Aeromicrobium sp.]
MASVVLASSEHRLAARRFEVERLVAALAVVLVFADLPSVSRFEVSLIVSAALAPVWLGLLRHYEGAVTIVTIAALALLNGLVLAMTAGSRLHGVSVEHGLSMTLHLLGFVSALGAVLWARTRLPLPAIGLLAGLAMLLTVSRTSALYASNPWRFGWSIPVTIVVLSLAWWSGSRSLQVVALLVLALLSVVNGGRSNFAMLALAAVLMVWQALAQRDGSRHSRSWIPIGLGLGLLAWVAYHAITWMILTGRFGSQAQERTVDQLNTSGSLLLGGRPELTATLHLMAEQPFGFGLGVLPTLNDILVAKSGMASINYDPNNGYVENYMLGHGFVLHSVFGDLWANFGVLGLVLAAAVLVIGFRATATRLQSGIAGGLVLYLLIRVAWGTGFSPFSTSHLTIALFLGLVLIARREEDPA